ncbi:hypothetical protein K0M31_012974, partial [Melipona bicolor]
SATSWHKEFATFATLQRDFDQDPQPVVSESVTASSETVNLATALARSRCETSLSQSSLDSWDMSTPPHVELGPPRPSVCGTSPELPADPRP